MADDDTSTRSPQPSTTTFSSFVSGAASPAALPPSSSSSSSSLPSSSSRQVPEHKNDPARTGFDPSTAWWINAFRILAGRMTAEGQFHYREWRYAVHEKRDCRLCEEARDWALARSPTVRFLADRIRAVGGNLDASNILCRRCPARLDEDGNVHRQGGGFSPAHGIMLCANEMQGKKHVEDVLAHEMVHAWDTLRWDMDPTGMKNLKHAACTEIRASMLSGECRFLRWGREARSQGDYTIMQQFQNCVRQRAILSMIARPRIKDVDHATRVVNSVWDSCFADTRPFDEVYR